MSIYLRAKIQAQEEKLGFSSEVTNKMALTSTYMEWVFRIATIGVSSVQFLIVHSKLGSYCSNSLGVLSPESEWLTYLVLMQLGKVGAFAFWQLKLLELKGLDDATLSFNSGSSRLSTRAPKEFRSELHND